MAINQDVSYVEILVATPLSSVYLPISILDGEITELDFSVDGVSAEEAGYTITDAGANTYTITPELPIGVVLLIQRNTDLDKVLYDFSSGAMFIASNMDENFLQVLYSQQEVRDKFFRLNRDTNNALDGFRQLVLDVQTEFKVVRAQVEHAEDVADTANQTSQAALAVANGIASTAQDALDTAERAETTANDIAGTANQAMTVANDAEVQAADAVIKAANATTIAEGIAGTANEANMVAYESRELAVEAKNIANDALAQTSLQPATATKLGGIKVGTEFAMTTDNTLTLSGTVTRDLQVNGGIVATGNITAFSDIRLKYDVNYVVDALDKVCSLNGVTFKRVYDHKPSVGLIAQDVQRVLPEAVIPQGDYLTVDYLGVIGLLVEAIKDLEHKVKLLGG